jgi:2-amino-4-hydroxy-6-hydroxymethyldihydropteridine diphosphokinase
VYVAIGANEGDPEQQVRAAINQLRKLSSGIFRASSLWESTPVDCPPGSPQFVNAVVELIPAAGDSPELLLERLQALEGEFGRRPKQRVNEARPLDLDLIAWEDFRIASPLLTVPHPRAHQRRFVLVPLSELAPNLILPGQTQTVTELLANLPIDSAFRCLGPGIL